jgi:hypothetical protein
VAVSAGMPMTAKSVVFFTSSCFKVTLYLISYSKIENRYNGHWTAIVQRRNFMLCENFYTKECLFKVSLINDERHYRI